MFSCCKLKSVCLVIVVCSTIFVSLFLLVPDKQRNQFTFEPQKTFTEKTEQFIFNGEKIVHIDLKGAPPKISYYEYLFSLLAKLGATGVLMEYEDMFPYSNKLANISALNCYTIDNIKTINELAKRENLKIIPLIPTFGHLEFILKLSQFEEYREVPEYPQVICPTYEKTFDLLKDMIEQIINAHPDLEYIHLGANEVYYLGTCSRCNQLMQNQKLTKNTLFIKHINTLTQIIKVTKPDVKVLIWDDELRSFSQQDLQTDRFNENIQPVVWKYTKDVYDDLGPSLWNNYKKVFKSVWIGSAFKGATSSNELVTSVTQYTQNHRSWMSVVAEYQNQIDFQGIIITGWQRHDHFSVLCELLPVGLPSLAMSLRIILGNKDSPFIPPTEVANLLRCKEAYALMGPAFGTPKCSFPGGEILDQVIHFQQLKQEFDGVLDNFYYKGWMSGYNIKHGFSNNAIVDLITTPLIRIKEELLELKTNLITSMDIVYDKYTVQEWIETYINPFEVQVEELWKARVNLLGKKNWNRRPLINNSL